MTKKTDIDYRLTFVGASTALLNCRITSVKMVCGNAYVTFQDDLGNKVEEAVATVKPLTDLALDCQVINEGASLITWSELVDKLS